MAEKYSADVIDSREPAKPKAPPSAGNGPACDDRNYWSPSDDPAESTIDEIEKGFGLK